MKITKLLLNLINSRIDTYRKKNKNKRYKEREWMREKKLKSKFRVYLF
jgi:hypothetical protein